MKPVDIRRLRRDRPELSVVHAESDTAVFANPMLNMPLPLLDFPGRNPLGDLLKHLATFFNATYGNRFLKQQFDFKLDTAVFRPLGVNSLYDLKVSGVSLEGDRLEGVLCQILDKVEGHTVTFRVDDDAILITTGTEPNWKTRASELHAAYKPVNEWLQYVLRQPAVGEYSGTTELCAVVAALEAHATTTYGKGWNGSNWRLRFAFDPAMIAGGVNPSTLTVADLSFEGKNVKEAISHMLGKVTTHKLKSVICYGKIVITEE